MSGASGSTIRLIPDRYDAARCTTEFSPIALAKVALSCPSLSALLVGMRGRVNPAARSAITKLAPARRLRTGHFIGEGSTDAPDRDNRPAQKRAGHPVTRPNLPACARRDSVSVGAKNDVVGAPRMATADGATGRGRWSNAWWQVLQGRRPGRLWRSPRAKSGFCRTVLFLPVLWSRPSRRAQRPLAGTSPACT